MGIRLSGRSVLAGLMVLVVSGQAVAAEIDMSAIAHIESTNRAWIQNGRAIGLCQITPDCLADYNRSHKTRFRPKDMFRPELNVQVADWYYNQCIPSMIRAGRMKDSIEMRILLYNWGVGNVKDWMKRGAVARKIPKESKDYIVKYKKFTNKKAGRRIDGCKKNKRTRREIKGLSQRKQKARSFRHANGNRRKFIK